MSAAADLTVANTILCQLGGNMFRAMTGARDFLGDARSLRFRIGRNAHAITAVRVTLEADDTYTVDFIRGAGTRAYVARTRTGVYADVLRAVFELETGMYASIGRVSR